MLPNFLEYHKNDKNRHEHFKFLPKMSQTLILSIFSIKYGCNMLIVEVDAICLCGCDMVARHPSCQHMPPQQFNEK